MKSFIHLAIFALGILSFFQTQASPELSIHGRMNLNKKIKMQLQEQEPQDIDSKRGYGLGAEFLYRHFINNQGSMALGVRYGYGWYPEKKDSEGTIESIFQFDHKIRTHRVALSANYRFHVSSFFVGVVAGIDIWKNLKISFDLPPTSQEESTSGTDANALESISSNQFLWQRITGQLGLEIGLHFTPQLLVKVEGGYDLSSFDDLKQNAKLPEEGETEISPVTVDMPGHIKLNSFYILAGIGFSFGG